jgi:hypothetical protein
MDRIRRPSLILPKANSRKRVYGVDYDKRCLGDSNPMVSRPIKVQGVKCMGLSVLDFWTEIMTRCSGLKVDKGQIPR